MQRWRIACKRLTPRSAPRSVPDDRVWSERHGLRLLKTSGTNNSASHLLCLLSLFSLVILARLSRLFFYPTSTNHVAYWPDH